MAKNLKTSKADLMRKGTFKRKLKLSEIQELAFVIVVIKRDNEKYAVEIIKKNNGIVLSRSRGKGVSRLSPLNSIGAFTMDVNVVFACVRVEDVQVLMEELEFKLKLEMAGNGRAMVVDVDGYMGAKAPFVEA